MSTSPRISVVLPVYNRDWCVGEAIESVLAQRDYPLELIVVDDGSTDRTADVLARFERQAPDTVRVLTHAGGANCGIARSRNLGARQARGEFLGFLDSDDLFCPNRFARAIPYLDANSGVAGCIEPFTLIELGRADCGRTEHHLAEVARSDCGWLAAMLFSTVYWTTPVLTLRRNAFEDFGGFDETLRVGEDVSLWLRLAACDVLGYAQASQAVAVVRRHTAQSWTGTDERLARSVYLRIVHSALQWCRRHPEARACAVPLLQTRLETYLIETLNSASLGRKLRLGLTAAAAWRTPSLLLRRPVLANLVHTLGGAR